MLHPLHTLLAATLHRLLHVLRKRGAVVALEGQPAAPEPQRGAAGVGGGHGAGLAATPTIDPGERLGGLAEDETSLQPVDVSNRLPTTRGLCERRRGTNDIQATYQRFTVICADATV